MSPQHKGLVSALTMHAFNHLDIITIMACIVINKTVFNT